MNNISKIVFLLPLIILASCSTGRNKNINRITNIDIEINTDLKHDQVKVASLLPSDRNFCYPTCPNINSKVNILLNHDDYIINYNKKTKYADWVAYKINRLIVSGTNIKRTWRADPKLPLELAMIPADYKDAAKVCNYDRGHQAPLADFNNGLNWEKLNYLSNITPQKADLNRGAWYSLESKIRHLGDSIPGDMYVITGPYYTGKLMCNLPNARIPNTVPNGYWKIITFTTDKGIYRASFKFDQHIPKQANFCDYATTTKEIGKITNLNFKFTGKIENSRKLMNMIGCTQRQPYCIDSVFFIKRV